MNRVYSKSQYQRLLPCSKSLQYTQSSQFRLPDLKIYQPDNLVKMCRLKNRKLQKKLQKLLLCTLPEPLYKRIPGLNDELRRKELFRSLSTFAILGKEHHHTHFIVQKPRCSVTASGKLSRLSPKLYIPGTLNTDHLLWHTQLIVCVQ